MSGALPSSTIACPGCKNSIPAVGVERGSWLVCPKCNMRFLVAGDSLRRNSDDDEVFDMETPGEPIHSIPSLAPLEIPFVPVRSEADLPRSEAEEVALYESVMHEEAAEKKSIEEQRQTNEAEETADRGEWQPKKNPPAGLFRTEVMTFFFNPETLVRMICLAAILFFSLFVLDKAFVFLSVPSMGIATFGAWFGGMMFLILGAMASVVCFVYAAALAMSILIDTANGQKRIHNWPQGFFVEWLHEAGYLAGAFFWSLVPGIPLGFLPESCGVLVSFVSKTAAVLLFPVVLLAELDAGCFFFPGSPAVWKNFLLTRRTWTVFYLITLPPVVVANAVVAYAYNQDMVGLLLISSIFAAGGHLLYFRLLGRLAWYASGKAEAGEEVSSPI